MIVKYCPHCLAAISNSLAYCSSCGRSVSVQNDESQLTVGTIVSGGHSYLVGKTLGKDALGNTYVARDVQQDELVVLRELFPSDCGAWRSSDGFVQHAGDVQDSFSNHVREFHRVAQAVLRVGEIPRITRALECFDAFGTAYLVSEFVEGTQLGGLMRTQTSLEPSLFLQRMAPLLRSLEVLNDRGVLHGCIEPNNIVKRSNGDFTLMSVGYARAHTAFLPPERLEGAADTPSTDVYSLCATAYFCLTGTEPASSFDRVAALKQGKDDPLRSFGEHGVLLSPTVDQALMRGLSVDAHSRLQSVSDLAVLIEQALEERDQERRKIVIEQEESERRRCIWCMTHMAGMVRCPACGRAESDYRPPLHHLAPGTILNQRYLLGVALGEGGYGVTYLGFDLVLERKVAVKEYFPLSIATRRASDSTELVDRQGVPRGSVDRGSERLFQEARALAKCGADSLAPMVLDCIAANRTAYIVMEYVDGKTLSEYVHDKSERVPLAVLLNMTEPVFQALQELHKSGLVHCDVSPHNIVVGTDGARLVDYGLACRYDGKKRMPYIAYTTNYAPPEQCSGGGQGPWTDVYALCATVYECITGWTVPPALDRLAGKQLVPPSKAGAELTKSQENALMRGLALKPADRFQSVADLQEALVGNHSHCADRWWKFVLCVAAVIAIVLLFLTVGL